MRKKVKEQTPVIQKHDFSMSNASEDLTLFQRQLLQEAFNEAYSSREYFIKADAVAAVKERALEVCSNIFYCADQAEGPWKIALDYCKMRLEEAEEKELDNKKKHLLTTISETYLSKVKTHQDFAEFQSMVLMELGNLTAKYEDKLQDEVPGPKINEDIVLALSEAAAVLVEEPIEKQEQIVKEAVEEAVKEVAEKTVINIKEYNSKYYNRLFELIKDKKTGKLNGDVFMKLKAEDQFNLLRIIGISEENLLNPQLLTNHIKQLATFIEEDFQ